MHSSFVLSILSETQMSHTAVIEISIGVSPMVVWEGLTRAELVKRYFFGTDLQTSWEVGSPIKFIGEWEGVTYEDKGLVLKFEPYQEIKYNYWSSMSGLPDEAEHYTVITYTLEEEGFGTKLRIEQGPMKDEETAAHSEGNWLSVMVGMKELLETGI